MAFNDSNLKKVCEWFPPSFLMKEKVFAIQEVEPALLKIFTRVHEAVNKQGRKRGGRKVLLLGQEVFGDTFLACGRCGYHSSDNSNVRKHHRRMVCLVDRGYSRSQLKGMDAKERKNFLQQLSSRRYREKCRNASHEQRMSEASADTCKPCLSQPPSSLTLAVVPASQPVTTIGNIGSFTLPAPNGIVHLTTVTGDEVPSFSTGTLEERLAGRGNSVSNLSSVVSHSGVGALGKRIDCGNLLNSPLDDFLDRCAINSEMKSCVVLGSITYSDLGYSGGRQLNVLSNCNDASSTDAAVGNGGRTTPEINMKDNELNPVTTRTDFIPHESGKVLCNQSSVSKSVLNSDANTNAYFSVPVSSCLPASKSISSLGHAGEILSPKILKLEDYGTAPNVQINELQHPDINADALLEVMPICYSKTAVTNVGKGSSLNSNTDEGCPRSIRPNGNESDGRLESNNSLAGSPECETIVLVPNCLPEATQPNLCIISMLEVERGKDSTTKPESSLSALPSSSPQFVSLPSSSMQFSKSTCHVPSHIPSVMSEKVLLQSENTLLPDMNTDAVEAQSQNNQIKTKTPVVQRVHSFVQSSNSVSLNSAKVSLLNNSGGDICQIIYTDDDRGKIPTMSPDVTGLNPTLPRLADRRAPTPTTLSLGGHSPVGNVCLKSSQSTDSLGQETSQKKIRKRKGLTLGPVEAREPIERLTYDLYTVNEHYQKVAWKPTLCHKAPSAVGTPPCQIAFRGARRCRRCLALPLPCLLLYRKLDCRTHHCHFTLFHPHARHQLAMQGDAVRATVRVRIYADTVMSQEFHHYLRSLWSCRLKPSQASRHITGVWAEVLIDKITDYYLDLEQRQAPPLGDRGHIESLKRRNAGEQGHQGLPKRRRMENAVDQGLPKQHQGASVDQEHLRFSQHRHLENARVLGQEDHHTTLRNREQQKLRGFNEQNPLQLRSGKKNSGEERQDNGCKDGSPKRSEGSAGVGAFENGSDPDAVTSFDENLGGKLSRTSENKLREGHETLSETLDGDVFFSDRKSGRNSFDSGCCGEICGSSAVSNQRKKPRSLNLLSERYRSITSLSKQTVKTLWRHLEEEESSRPSLDRFRLKRVGGSDRKRDRLHCKLVKYSSLLRPRSRQTLIRQCDDTTVPLTELKTHAAGPSPTELNPQRTILNNNTTTNSIEVEGNELQISVHEQQILKQCEMTAENDSPDSLKVLHPRHESMRDNHSEEVFYSDSDSVRAPQCLCHGTVDRTVDGSCMSSRSRELHTQNDVKTFPSGIPSASSGCYVPISPTLHSFSLVASPVSNVQVMASSVKFPSNQVHQGAAEIQFSSHTHVPLCSVPSSETIGFPQPTTTTTTYSLPQIAPLSSSSSLASFITQPPLLMRQTIPQSSLMRASFITRFHPQNEPRLPVMQPSITNTSLRLCQPLHQQIQDSSSTAQEIGPHIGDTSSPVSAQLVTTSTLLQPMVSICPESWAVAPLYSHQHHQNPSCHGVGESDHSAATDIAIQLPGNQQCPPHQQYPLAIAGGVTSTAPSYNLQLYPQTPHVAYHEQ